VKIIVFDVPATEAGALTVLLDFYRFVVASQRKDIEWIFVVSTEMLGTPPEGCRIRIVRYPEVKRNWTRRILFELFVAPRLVNRYQADAILSLQNTAILWTRIPQVVYVHNSIPYATQRFAYTKRDERAFAIIGDVFRPLIGWSVRKSKAAVVQTKWLKTAIERTHGIGAGRIAVVPQTIEVHASPRGVARIPGRFFYPASPFVYKQHKEIVEAVTILQQGGRHPKIVFTIDGTENSYARTLAKEIRDRGLEDCFELAGRVSRERAIELYQESVVLFVSRLESFGLPLLEARLLSSPVIATRQPFSEEILEGYAAATLVDQGATSELAASMERYCDSTFLESVRKEDTEQPVEYSTPGGWASILELLVRNGRWGQG